MTRLRLSGFGTPIPVPDDIPEDSSDSVGTIPRLNYSLENGSIFRPAEYLALHYTHYEVVVIGAAGGLSGPIRSNENLFPSLVYGGAGGGGGLHIVKGRLIDLPSEVPIVVGQPGANAIITDAGDGGASLFGEVAKASGGKGGKVAPPFKKFTFRVKVGGPLYEHYSGGGNGGDGGKGGRTLAGGGALGARFTQPVPPVAPAVIGTGYNSVEAEDGKWDGIIGEGGGGGMGGVWPSASSVFYNTVKHPVHPGTTGGKGSFNYGDTSRFMPGEPYNSTSANGYIIPGHGGGASTNRRTLGSNYGGYEARSLEQSHPEGVVFIRLRRSQ